jgi:hypothetical protein
VPKSVIKSGGADRGVFVEIYARRKRPGMANGVQITIAVAATGWAISVFADAGVVSFERLPCSKQQHVHCAVLLHSSRCVGQARCGGDPSASSDAADATTIAVTMAIADRRDRRRITITGHSRSCARPERTENRVDLSGAPARNTSPGIRPRGLPDFPHPLRKEGATTKASLVNGGGRECSRLRNGFGG